MRRRGLSVVYTLLCVLFLGYLAFVLYGAPPAAVEADAPGEAAQEEAGRPLRALADVLHSRVLLPLQGIYQKPELPNGCEATSLAAILRYYGYPADKIELAYTFIPRKDFVEDMTQRHGADPEAAYAGDPAGTGFYCFGTPLAQGANAYLQSVGAEETAEDLTGCTPFVLRRVLAEGRPVAVWTTLKLEALQYSSTYWWNFFDSETLYIPQTNLHCVVLYGYDADSYYLFDPLYGAVSAPRLLFETRWIEMGSRAVALDQAPAAPPFLRGGVAVFPASEDAWQQPSYQEAEEPIWLVQPQNLWQNIWY